MQIIVSEANTKKRLDSFCASMIFEFSRENIKSLIKEGNILVNGLSKKSSYLVNQNDVIDINIPEKKPKEILPEKINLDIIYEDKDLLVVNKPKGMVVHPGSGNYTHTLVNALMAYTDELSTINGSLRPGIIHRIDKDTSGLLLVAKNNFAHQDLAGQLKNHSIQRIYYAIVNGRIKNDKGTINLPIGRHPINRKRMAVVDKNSKHAITHYQVIKRYIDYSFVRFALETGRTHQIRVHMEKMGHPVLGDPVYGHKKQKFKLNGQCLHAQTIGFIHPETKRELIFTTPLPQEMVKVLEKIKN